LAPDPSPGRETRAATRSHPPAGGRRLAGLALGALGIVYGDIGTSPLYAFRECFSRQHGIAINQPNVLGILSLILWSLILVVTLKYHVYVLRFDNRGEGGVLALMGLIGRDRRVRAGLRGTLVLLGVFGAALLYGDGMITPAISVLSAVEGLDVATPFFARAVIPITAAILVGLFLFQKRGTARVGSVFGPVILLWFATLAGLGIASILKSPQVLAALNPMNGVRFFLRNGLHGYLVLGAVFLVATGGEALYADMGHFGERPIQIDWFTIVGPSLLLNYFGQGALLLRNPAASHNPFYLLAPHWALYPLVILATAATVIASQAIISGAFSLTRQAIQLGYLPRMQIVHTSQAEIGQIYVPAVNTLLALATIALVLGFRTSSNLAAAYGVAVTTTMVITTLLAFFAARDRLGWSTFAAGAVTAGFLVVDLAFFGANIVKIPQGGWFPLLVGGAVLIVMTTWRKGRRILNRRLHEGGFAVPLFLKDVDRHPPIRVPGTAIFMTRVDQGVPLPLLHNLKHNKVLHERVVFLTIVTEEVPYVGRKRTHVESLGSGIHRIILRYGFMEDPDVPAALARIEEPGLVFPENDTTFFLGKETIFATRRPGMAMWRERLFAVMARNASSATLFFKLPPNRVVELGAQIEM
jgi:KUP system potassium uptake protein